MKSNICDFCKHYDYVSWAYKQKGCTIANTRSGSDGYGPFYSSAKCIHDKHQNKIEDKFEIASVAERSKDMDIINNLKNEILDLKCKIQKLKDDLLDKY
jgi:hypothetical protein